MASQNPTSQAASAAPAGPPATTTFPGRASGLRTGFWVTAGWLLADLAVFTEYGALAPALELLPEALWALALGALLGLLVGGPARTVAALTLVGLATALSLAVRLPLPATGLIALRVGLLWLIAFALARLVSNRWHSDRVRVAGLALGLGVIAAALQISAHYGLSERETRLLFGAAALLASHTLRSKLASLLVATFAAAWLLFPGPGAHRALDELRRPDLPSATVSSKPTEASPNLLLMVLDTVRADRLGCYGYGRDTTPRLDRFAAERATRYTQARSTSSWTLPSHASLFTGLLPAEHGATHPRAGANASTLDPAWPAQPLRAEVPTLAERLRDRGYATAAIVSNPLYLRYEFGLDRGFEHYDDRDPYSVPRYLALPQLLGRKPWVANRGYRDARQITNLAVDWLVAAAADERPFFLALNYMDAHMPYVPPAPFDRAFSPQRPETPLSAPQELHSLLYDRELAYLDHQVGVLLDHLEQARLLETTIVVITSDHGEAFGEHGFWKHDWTLFDEVVRVPLLIATPDARAPGESPLPLSGADVHDLITELCGLTPDGGAPRDLTSKGAPRVSGEWYRVRDDEAWEQRFGGIDLDRDLVAWIEGGIKTVVSTHGDVQAFDLLDDPLEEHPLILGEAQLDLARTRAQAWWRDHPPPDLTTGDMDAATLEKMRALGYLDDGGDDGQGD